MDPKLPRSSADLVRATPILWSPDRHYAVTITFKPKLEIPHTKVYRRSVLNNHITETRIIKTTLCKKSPQQQFELTKNLITSILDKELMEYHLFAEYHKNGSIHYHGIIGHKLLTGSLVRSQINYNLSKLGRCQVDDLKDPAGWLEYCTKDSSCSKLQFDSATSH